MKKALGNLLNSKRKPVKVNGRIVSNPSHLEYVIATNSGRMKVDAVVPYEIGKRVVVYDGLIQGYAGAEPAATCAEV